ncbi:MAG: SAM-dependent methyltransferase, partial [Calditrichaeota bacterium]|nr:SAM-dependent methyltransferase [Calditrichota bacterium]
QCGGYGEVDLIERFTGKGSVTPIDWTAAVAKRQLENSGFEVLFAQEVFPISYFLDIGAVVYYLKATPWLIEDFNVVKYRSQLLEIHRYILEHGKLDMTDQRFLIEAIKSG